VTGRELPPPPGSPGWSPPAPSSSAASSAASSAGGGSLLDRPAWRQGHPWWALLHVAIGLGIAIVAFFVAVVAGMIGRTQTQLDNADDGPVAIGTLLVLGSSVVAWFLFAYLGWSIGRRAAVLAAAVGGSCVIAAVLFSVASR
jgi:hypothetical protein